MNRKTLFWLALVCVVAIVPLQGGMSISSGGGGVSRPISPVIDLAEGGSGSGSAAGARTNFDVYSKEETDNLAAQSTLRYYLQDVASDIGGYEGFATAPIIVQASEAMAAIGTTYTLLDQPHLTPLGTPNITTLVSGVYEVTDYYSKTGGGDITLAYEFWIRNLAGTERFVATSSATLLQGTLTKYQVNSDIVVSVATTTASTDRLVLKAYALRTSAATLTRWYGDATSGFFGVLISPRNFARTDLSNLTASGVAAIASYAGTADIASALAHIVGP